MREHAEEARERRLSGNHNDDTSFPLKGYCFDNAYVVYTVLAENGYNPQIVAGLSEDFAEDLLREVPIEEIETVEDLAGQVHFWVEANGKIIDISPEDERYRGEIYIDSSLPDSYHRLSNSYEYGDEVLQDAHQRRCSYCGGRENACGCPKQN